MLLFCAAAMGSAQQKAKQQTGINDKPHVMQQNAAPHAPRHDAQPVKHWKQHPLFASLTPSFFVRKRASNSSSLSFPSLFRSKLVKTVLCSMRFRPRQCGVGPLRKPLTNGVANGQNALCSNRCGVRFPDDCGDENCRHDQPNFISR